MIRLLVRLYPPAWRRRYGAELAALLDETGLDVPIVFDVLRGALRSRVRAVQSSLQGDGTMVLGPAWRHPTAWALFALLILVPTAAFMTASALAFQLGFTAWQEPMQSVISLLDGLRIVDLGLVVAPALALLGAIAPLLRLEVRGSEAGRELRVAIRLRALNLAIALAALTVGGFLVAHILVETVLRIGP